MSIDVNPDDDFHIVVDGSVMTMSLDDLDDWYQQDLIDDGTLIWQQGLGEWMRLDVVLAELEKNLPVAPAPPVAEDVYFVLVAEGEVKQMSLDLLADSYRFDVIDEGTLVWQPGYKEWIPLSLLIGDEPEQHVSIMPSLAPSSGSSTTTHSPVAQSAAPSYAPRPTSSTTNQWGAPSNAPASSSFGPYSFGTNSFGASAPPVALSVPMAPPSASPWFSRSLVALSCVAVVFAMYRNGVGADAAAGMGQGQQLASLEAKFQKPGRDTPHGLDAWLTHLNQKFALDDLSETDPVPKAEAVSAAPAVAKAEPKPEIAEAPAEAPKEKAAAAAATDTLPVANEGAAAAFGAKLANEPEAAKKSPIPARTYKKAVKRAASSGDPNDPMNGNL